MVRDGDILPSTDAEELIDFTCVTPWERLALDIELQLRKWGLQNGQQPSHQPQSTPHAHQDALAESCIIDPTPIARALLSMGDRTFWLELRSAPSNDSLDSHPLERLLGVNKSVMLMADTPDGIVADDASDAAVLLSAMAVAASGCACSLPIIIPVGRPSSLRFVGRQVLPNHLRFTCDYSSNPANDNSLSSLVELLQNKRAAARPLSASIDTDVLITAKFTYEWDDFSFRVTPVPGTFVADRRLSAVQMVTLNDADPVRKIRVTALWDQFSASDLQQNRKLAAMPAETATRIRLSPSGELLKSIANSQIPSYRTPLTAPARANLRMAQAASLQVGNELPAAPVAVIDLRMYREAIDSHRTSPRTSHFPTDETTSPRVARPPAPSALEQFLTQVNSYVAAEALKDDKIDEEFLTSAVAALFEMDLGKGIMVDVVEALGPNAAEMTVLERVSRLVAASENIAAAQKLWILFLDGVEVHWEQQWIICGVPFSAERGPDHNENLMTQKLQMLNCCVERRRREVTGVPAGIKGAAENNLGRKKVLEGVELIGDGGIEDGDDRRVWEPFVQPHPLTTRDMVEEELKRIVQRAEGRDRSDEAEAKRQCLTLKSDMMAFKAANPKACLADFVRWFSPTDWTEEEVTEESVVEGGDENTTAKANGKSGNQDEADSTRRRGRLSARMGRSGNIWEELWKNAEKVRASKQVPLFHASENGRKALADLRAMPMTQVLLHLAVILGSSATQLLQRAFTRPPQLPIVRQRIERARQAIGDESSALGLNEAGALEMGRVAASLDSVAIAEHSALLATSMLMKLPPTNSIGVVVDGLANGEAVDVCDERDRALLIRMTGLGTGWGSALLPERQEFVLSGTKEVAQDRMYARISSEEFRVAFRLGLDYEI